MLELEPDPMSIPDISMAFTNGRRTVARRSNGLMRCHFNLNLISHVSRIFLAMVFRIVTFVEPNSQLGSDKSLLC